MRGWSVGDWPDYLSVFKSLTFAQVFRHFFVYDMEGLKGNNWRVLLFG